MKKLTQVAVFALSGFCASIQAASGPFSGIWTLSWDKSLDNIAVAEEAYSINMNSHHTMFTAEYATINNDSIISGQTYFDPARSTTLIQFKQVDNTYYRVFSGRKEGNDSYVGTWYDNSGQSGDFRLRK